jgi:hypothetical protein
MGYSPEYVALEGDPAYLSRLAALGGGAVLDGPAAVFSHDLKGAGVRRDLWPYLLGLAALLLPIDVGVRRLALGRRDLLRARAWLAARLPRRRPRPAAQAPSPVARLFDAKSRAGERAPAGRDLSEAAPAEPEAAPPPAERPSAPPLAAPSSAPCEKVREDAEELVEEGTLAGRLLRRKRERGEGT